MEKRRRNAAQAAHRKVLNRLRGDLVTMTIMEASRAWKRLPEVVAYVFERPSELYSALPPAAEGEFILRDPGGDDVAPDEVGLGGGVLPVDTLRALLAERWPVLEESISRPPPDSLSVWCVIVADGFASVFALPVDSVARANVPRWFSLPPELARLTPARPVTTVTIPLVSERAN